MVEEMDFNTDFVESEVGRGVWPVGELAAAMRDVKVGVAWDRHIWATSGEGTWCLLEDHIPGTVRHDRGRCAWVDFLGGTGANLALNIRILDQVILLLCGPWHWDWGSGMSGSATASEPFRWGVKLMGGSLRMADSDLLDTLHYLQGAPGMDRVPQLGEIPSSFRRIPGGEELMRDYILSDWATAFFKVIQDSGVSGFERLGTKADTELQRNWDEIVRMLEAK